MPSKTHELLERARPCVSPSCDHLTVWKDGWERLARDERAQLIRRGYRSRRLRGLCTTCAKRGENGTERGTRRTQVPRDVIAEDYPFMRANGETFEGAARRLGMTPGALERAIVRARKRGEAWAHEHDLYRNERDAA